MEKIFQKISEDITKKMTEEMTVKLIQHASSFPNGGTMHNIGGGCATSF